MTDCIFCKIIGGEIPSFKVYENEDVLAFLDIHPFSQGHCLVVPRKHFENIFDIEKDILEKVILAGKHIAEKIKVSLNADGIRLMQSNGSLAGQEVMHFHLHIIPRYESDGLMQHPTGNYPMPQANFEELKSLSEKLK